jgi:TrmH family RNA methyltransferase
VLTLVRPRVSTLDAVLKEDALAVILDGVQDPGNAGAVIRSAEAFGASGVIFLKGSVNPYNPKCLRGSAGSIFRLPVVSAVEDEALQAALTGIALLTAMPHSERVLAGADFRRACAVVIGGEGRGVRPELAALAEPLRIPTVGVESLNAAVACGVILYEARRQRSHS